MMVMSNDVCAMPGPTPTVVNGVNGIVANQNAL